MSDRERPNQFSFELPPDLRDGLLLLRERDGAPVAESIRRAIRAWLEAKEALPTPPKASAGRKGAKGGKR